MSEPCIDEEIERAYANVGLLASNVWNFNRDVIPVSYHRANLNLWIQFNEIEQQLIGDDSTEDRSTSSEDIRTVRDTIPFSRLASYGAYPYNEERENLYLNNDDLAHFTPRLFQNNKTNLEIWMLPEVEEEFMRISNTSSSKCCFLSPRLPLGSELISENKITNTNSYQWLTNTSWPYQLVYRYPDLTKTLQDARKLSLFTEEFTLPNYNSDDLQEKLQEFPCPTYSLETKEDFELHTRIDSPKVRNIWNHHFHYGNGFSLNAESPEFKPAAASRPVMNFPSIFDESYEEAMFPYSFDMTFIEEMCHHSMPSQSSCKNEKLADYPIEKNRPMVEISIQRNTCIFYTVDDDLSNTKLCQTQKMLKDIHKWVDRVYQTRLEDFTALSATSFKIREIFQNIHNLCLFHQIEQETEFMKTEEKYEELEREALEQYFEPVPVENLEQEALAQDCEHVPAEKLKRKTLKQNYKPIPVTNKSSCILESSQAIKEVIKEKNHISGNIASSKANYAWHAKPSKNKRRVRFSDLSPHNSASHDSGLKKSIEGRFFAHDYSPSKQSVKIKRKVTKKEKKKRTKKCNKKSADSEFSQKVLLIDEFNTSVENFKKSFVTSEWKLIQPLLPYEVVVTINDCLQISAQCSQCFVKLMILKNTKEKFDVDKVLPLAKTCTNLLQMSFCILNQYVNIYSTIMKTIPFDNRFAQKWHVKPSLLYLKQSVLLDYNYVHSNNLYRKKDNLLKLPHLKTTYGQELFCSNRDWKLKLNPENICRNQPCVQVSTKNEPFHVAVKKPLEVDYENMNKASKSVIILNDDDIWNSGQWEHLDGWEFKEIGNHVDWCFKFDIKDLDNITSSINLAIWCNWCILCSINKILNSTACTKCVPLWCLKELNLIPKIDVLHLLVKNTDDWHFKYIYINRKACSCTLEPFYENVCEVQIQKRHYYNSKVKNTYTISSEDLRFVSPLGDSDSSSSPKENASSILKKRGSKKVIDKHVYIEKKPLKNPCFIL